MHPRCGQLSRESERLGITREVHFSDISFRVYRFAREFYVANQASTTCRLCLESTVETSTPPFWEEESCTPSRGGQHRVCAIPRQLRRSCVDSRRANTHPPPDCLLRQLRPRRLRVEEGFRPHLQRRWTDDSHRAIEGRWPAERVLSALLRLNRHHDDRTARALDDAVGDAADEQFV